MTDVERLPRPAGEEPFEAPLPEVMDRRSWYADQVFFRRGNHQRQSEHPEGEAIAAKANEVFDRLRKGALTVCATLTGDDCSNATERLAHTTIDTDFMMPEATAGYDPYGNKVVIGAAQVERPDALATQIAHEFAHAIQFAAVDDRGGTEVTDFEARTLASLADGPDSMYAHPWSRPPEEVLVFEANADVLARRIMLESGYTSHEVLEGAKAFHYHDDQFVPRDGSFFTRGPTHPPSEDRIATAAGAHSTLFPIEPGHQEGTQPSKDYLRHSATEQRASVGAMSGTIPDEMRDRVLGRVADDVPLHEIKDWVGNSGVVAHYEGRTGVELEDWTRTDPSTGHDHLDSGRFLADPDAPGVDGIKLFLEEAVVHRGASGEAGEHLLAEDRHRAPLDSRAWGDVPDQIEAFVADLNRVHRGALDPSQIESRNPLLAGDGPAFGMQDAYDVTPGAEATEIPSAARPPRLSTRSQGQGR